MTRFSNRAAAPTSQTTRPTSRFNRPALAPMSDDRYQDLMAQLQGTFSETQTNFEREKLAAIREIKAAMHAHGINLSQLEI